MIDQQDPLSGCRVKWDAHTSASGTPIPAGEGTYEGACLCRLDDGSPARVGGIADCARAGFQKSR